MRDLSPLEEIEHTVQERAKDISLEMRGADGAEKLRDLIQDEVARWSLDHRRGARPFDLADPDLVAERAFRNLAGYGPLGPLLDDDDVWEIMINAPDQVFAKRHRGRSGYHDEVFHDDDHVVRTLTKILDDASASHRKLDAAEGLQDAQLDNGSRLHIVHADVSSGGHVMVNIRKFTGCCVPAPRPARRARHAHGPGRRVPVGVREGGPHRGGRWSSGLGQDDAHVLLHGRARPISARRRGRGGVRGRRPAPERGQHADAGGPPRPARSRPPTSWSPASCAWPPTWPSSARCATVRLFRCCSRCPRACRASRPSTPVPPVRPSHACASSASSPSPAHPCPSPRSTASSARASTSSSTALVAAGVPRVTEVLAVEDLAGGPEAAQFTVTQVFDRPGPDQELRWSGNLPARAERALAGAGFDVRGLLGATSAPVGDRW